MTRKHPNPYFVDRWTTEHFDPYKDVKDQYAAKRAASRKEFNKAMVRMHTPEVQERRHQTQIEAGRKKRVPITLPKVSFKDE